MRVGERAHAGAEFDSLGALGGGDQEHFRRRDRLPSGGVMLADPEFVVVKFVERLSEFEVALERELRMLPDWMMRREKHAEAKSLGHSSELLLLIRPTTFMSSDV